ncbi:MAG: hypothetical protein ACK5QX_05865, partial [bacterium]
RSDSRDSESAQDAQSPDRRSMDFPEAGLEPPEEVGFVSGQFCRKVQVTAIVGLEREAIHLISPPTFTISNEITRSRSPNSVSQWACRSLITRCEVARSGSIWQVTRRVELSLITSRNVDVAAIASSQKLRSRAIPLTMSRHRPWIRFSRKRHCVNGTPDC